MDVFELRDKIVCGDYAKYTSSFIEIADERIREEVEAKFRAGLLWPEPLLQLNPSFESGGGIDELVREKVLHPLCGEIFRLDKSPESPSGSPMRLYRHQTEAINAAQSGENYVLTTGTGSGKSLSYIVPIVDFILKNGTGRGIQAIIVYPMNALANSQELELEKFLKVGAREYPVSFRRYTGQENEVAREEIIASPPDILLTNYVMLELILTRWYEKKLVTAANGLKFLVFDELHTYRGRQGADVAMLIRRLRQTLNDGETAFQCIGTSATLAGDGSFEEKQKDVAALATKLFGSEVKAENVIVETLKAETGLIPPDLEDLKNCLAANAALPEDYESFIANPLVGWIENTIGVKMCAGRLERCKPRSLKGKNGLAETLAAQTGIAETVCAEKIKEALLKGSGVKKPGGAKPVFAFKLHQFISKGDTVYATLEPADKRLITLYGQKFAPGRDSGTLLYPLYFCRECGKEYYSVSLTTDEETGITRFNPLQSGDDPNIDTAGYLFIDDKNPWPEDVRTQLDRLPEDWLEEKAGQITVSRSRTKYLPQLWHIKPDGTAANEACEDSTPAWFLKAPFVFCPECLVSYKRGVDDFSKLATLGTEGRSTATTVLSMSTVNHLREMEELPDIARKFLCFSDNRQDASLQSGHFNDFVEIGLIRSALFNALEQAGEAGLGYGELPQKIFEALGLGYADKKFPRENYSATPDARYKRINHEAMVFRSVLEYRVYSDLRRGWRIVAPNLEQCGLLEIEYVSLAEICGDDDIWQGDTHLAAASPQLREKISLALLDYMRSRLAIKAECLDPVKQEEIARQSRQLLIEPWQIEDGERQYSFTKVYPRSRTPRDNSADSFLSPRGDFGRWLKSLQNFRGTDSSKVESVIKCLISALKEGGIIEAVDSGKDDPAYQLSAVAMRWKAGDGTKARHDRFRMRMAAGEFGRTNPFFVEMYRNAVKNGQSLSSREHTAQVPGAVREARETAFREARLPILYCSPTMELGVDISQLNAVGMRNVPPTPANYAQRSGRAGRSGQPALIITYCAQGNSHDQNFFRTPGQMVAGSVSTPRLDLANEDLVRAHVYALWLGASRLDLKKSPADLLELEGQKPTLALKESIAAALEDEHFKNQAKWQARKILHELKPELANCGWYHDSWLNETMNNLGSEFERACERWRDLYRSAVAQRDQQHAIICDASRSAKEIEDARELRRQAERLISSLTSRSKHFQDDFYSYRYFASEGFLPGYNFPRLPLYASINAKKEKKGREGYISRSRFLAISEFGPGSIIYHEGSKYVVASVEMDVMENSSLALSRLKLCENCGWLERDAARDICEMCASPLPPALNNLFRMSSVSTWLKERITSDDEERLRAGYQLISAYRFEEYGGMPSHRTASLYNAQGERLAGLKYGHGATLWRINMRWANSLSSPPGFFLDRISGKWVRDPTKKNHASKGRYGSPEDDLGDAESVENVERVIPYVEDRKNCLVLEPAKILTQSQMTSLRFALKQAIQQLYQLEDFELATEAMPSKGEPKTLLFYEAAEGGAGVLRHLVDDPAAIPAIAREALRICHFDQDGNDLKKAEYAEEECVAACYHCLLSYGNQRVHNDLNRHEIKDILLEIAKGSLVPAQAAKSRTALLERLKKDCDTNLERKWLDLLEKYNLRLPDKAQHKVEACQTRPDFWYEREKVAIYIDGPCHDHSDRQKLDQDQQECLENMGIEVIRFVQGEQWLAEIKRHRQLFGKVEKKGAST